MFSPLLTLTFSLALSPPTVTVPFCAVLSTVIFPPETLLSVTEPEEFVTETSEPVELTNPPVWFIPFCELSETEPDAVIFFDSSRSFTLSIVIEPLFAVRSFDRVILPPFVPTEEPSFMSVPADTVPKVTSESTLFTLIKPVVAVTSTVPPDEKSSATSFSPIFVPVRVIFPPEASAFSRSAFWVITPPAVAIIVFVAEARALNVISCALFNMRSAPDTAPLRIRDMSRASRETVLCP